MKKYQGAGRFPTKFTLDGILEIWSIGSDEFETPHPKNSRNT